ncbi:MAG TPA: hypothetical protein VIN08_04915 [Ohtaekwangia sp.]|uniref:hypothetical protein n=1 Tax=Ohtaekwangia sp. TaxID=2066019 RepID=UPI002F925627
MKKMIWGVLLAASVMACQDSETTSNDNDFTGNETVYALAAGSEYNIDGTVTMKEKKDGSTLISVTLTGTEGNLEFPVHIHLGDVATDGADVYALLNPVVGTVGSSETLLTKAADESTVTYKQLIALNACLKVHLSATGENKNIILAAGNIGTAASSATGRQEIAPCKSE